MKIILISFLFLIALLPNFSSAAGLVPCGGTGESPCTFCDFFTMINNIVREFFKWVVPTVAVLMLVVGGVLFLFAGAKPDTLRQAQGIITSVVIGLLIIFAAWVIVNTVLVKSGIVASPSLLQWYQIQCTVQ